MSYEVPGFKAGTEVAAVDLSAHQYKFAKMTANGVNIATAATDAVIGVIQNKPKAGEAVELDCDGVTKVISGGVIAKGAKVAPDANGKAVAYVSPGAYAAGSEAAGVAFEASAADGVVIAVKLGKHN